MDNQVHHIILSWMISRLRSQRTTTPWIRNQPSFRISEQVKLIERPIRAGPSSHPSISRMRYLAKPVSISSIRTSAKHISGATTVNILVQHSSANTANPDSFASTTICRW